MYAGKNSCWIYDIECIHVFNSLIFHNVFVHSTIWFETSLFYNFIEKNIIERKKKNIFYDV